MTGGPRDGWELLDFSTTERKATSLLTAQLAAPSDGRGARFHNIEWKLGPDPDWSRIRAYVRGADPTSSGFACFLWQDRPLVFHLGEVAVASASLSRLTMIGDLHLAADADWTLRVAAARNLLDAMVPTLRPGEALFFEGLPVDCATYSILAGHGASDLGVVAIQVGPVFDHQFIAFPSSFKDYVQQLGSRSRQSVQYSVRRLDKDMTGQVEVKKFETVEHVEPFLSDAAAISQKTYQANLLGLGLSGDAVTKRRLSYAAERGWLRSYILYCRDMPCAFMLGFQYGGCYYYDDVGYDPEFGKWSVGSVLQLKVVEEILGGPNPPKWFDFSTGFGQHKGRFGNTERREVNLLVLPRTVRNRALAVAYWGSEELSARVVRTLEKMGVKSRLKKYIRSWKRA